MYDTVVAKNYMSIIISTLECVCFTGDSKANLYVKIRI